MRSLVCFAMTLLLLITTACTRKEVSEDNSVFDISTNMLNQNPMTIHNRYIMLELNDEAMFTEISKMMCYKDRLIIFDGYLSNVFFFDMTGRFLGKLDHIGQGPGEYIRLCDFDVKDDCVYLYDDIQRKILSYDLHSLEYKGSTTTPFFARAISLLDNGNFLFVLPKDQQHKQVVVTDGSCNILAEYVDFKDDDKDNITRYGLLQKTNRGIVYSKMCSNDVYVFSSQDGALDETFQTLLDGKSYNLDKADGPQLISTPLVYKSGAVLGRLKIEKQIYHWESSLSDKKQYAVRKAGASGNKANQLVNPVCVVGDSMVASYLLEEMYEKMDKSFALDAEMEEYLAEGGFLIGIYELK